jgi:hypothetical protein
MVMRKKTTGKNPWTCDDVSIMPIENTGSAPAGWMPGSEYA